jgi:hypothetical protein
VNNGDGSPKWVRLWVPGIWRDGVPHSSLLATAAGSIKRKVANIQRKLTVDTTRAITQEYLLENGSDQIGEFILGKMLNTWLGERLDLRIYQSFREGCSLVTTINENDYPTLFKSFSVRL